MFKGSLAKISPCDVVSTARFCLCSQKAAGMVKAVPAA